MANPNWYRFGFGILAAVIIGIVLYNFVVNMQHMTSAFFVQ